MEALGNPLKKIQGDLDSISMPKLQEGAWGLEGWGIVATPQGTSLKRLTLPLVAYQIEVHK
jgi:hypothetical protein